MGHLTEILPRGWSSYGRGIAGAPSLEGLPSNPDLELIGWGMPPLLEAIYQTHHGLGPWSGGRWLPWALRPWPDAVALTRRVRFGEENICWDPADCVLVCADDRGGGWVLQDRQAPVWRWFDGGTHALGPPRTPWFALSHIVEHW